MGHHSTTTTHLITFLKKTKIHTVLLFTMNKLIIIALVAFACMAFSDAACSNRSCRMFCKYGFKKDSNGCEICECACKPVMCRMRCPFGFKKNEDGCEICECNKCP